MPSVLTQQDPHCDICATDPDARVSPCAACGGAEHPAHSFTAAPDDLWLCQSCTKLISDRDLLTHYVDAFLKLARFHRHQAPPAGSNSQTVTLMLTDGDFIEVKGVDYVHDLTDQSEPSENEPLVPSFQITQPDSSFLIGGRFVVNIHKCPDGSWSYQLSHQKHNSQQRAFVWRPSEQDNQTRIDIMVPKTRATILRTR